jgi:hypothetical protein
MFNQVSLSGTNNLLIQLGTSSGFENTDYVSSGFVSSVSTLSGTSVTNGFLVGLALSSRALVGFATIKKYSPGTNLWHYSSAIGTSGSGMSVNGGIKTISNILTRVRITRDGGDTFDGGAINVSYR